MAEYTKPLPFPDQDTQPYWEAAKAHELRVQRCDACGKLRWPPRGFCPFCYSWTFAWVPIAQTGTVKSYVVVYHAPPGFAEDVPFVIARVTLDETEGNVTIDANLVDCSQEQVHVGMPVQVVFDDVTPEVTLPKFRRAG